MTYACSIEEFLRDVSMHQMTVIRADGVFRHIRYRRPDESMYWFDLITWPGTLCIDGDIGTFVFRRLNDMFEFFRTDQDYAKSKGIVLGVNPRYWAEKLQAMDTSGYKEFNSELFTKIVTERFNNWVEENEPDEELKADVWYEVDNEVLYYANDGHTRAFDAAASFRSTESDLDFPEFWEHDLETYTFHYIWCCYAIVWGIDAYDKSMGEP